MGLGGANDVGPGCLLRTTAVDQLGATLTTWMGDSASDLPTGPCRGLTALAARAADADRLAKPGSIKQDPPIKHRGR